MKRLEALLSEAAGKHDVHCAKTHRTCVPCLVMAWKKLMSGVDSNRVGRVLDALYLDLQDKAASAGRPT